MHFSYLFFILCPTFHLTGRGARVRETTTRERGSRRSAPVSPSLLRFSLAHVSQAKLRSLPKANVRSLSLSLTPSSAHHCRCVFFGQSRLLRFRRSRPPAYAPDALRFHYSLFILHYSLFTLSVGSSHATEAASSGVYCECWASHAAGSRREMEAGTARPPACFLCVFMV